MLVNDLGALGAGNTEGNLTLFIICIHYARCNDTMLIENLKKKFPFKFPSPSKLNQEVSVYIILAVYSRRCG